METFEQAFNRLRGGRSLREVADLAKINDGHLSRIARGLRPPTAQAAAALDRALNAGGELAALVEQSQPQPAATPPPWQTAELLGRLRANSVDSIAVESMHATAYELCCQYPTREASALRAEAHDWLGEITRLVHQPVGLRAHSELLLASGWLALLVSCLEYDMGMRAGAEATRTSALGLGVEAGHPEIVGWAHEISAWFALTQGRYRAVLDAAEAGLQAAPGGSSAVQLRGQEAKAYARLGDIEGVRGALDRGAILLDGHPRPARPEHHFVVDPDKQEFFAMDAYRQVGDDERAARHAQAVLDLRLAPMRMTEARLTLAAVAARGGDLEQAVATGVDALGGERKSLPSLLMVAGELAHDLQKRYPGESGTADFREALHAVKEGPAARS